MTTTSATTILINDEWRETRSRSAFPMTNPASGAVIGWASGGGAEDAAAAIAAAAAAFNAWAGPLHTSVRRCGHRRT